MMPFVSVHMYKLIALQVCMTWYVFMDGQCRYANTQKEMASSRFLERSFNLIILLSLAERAAGWIERQGFGSLMPGTPESRAPRTPPLKIEILARILCVTKKNHILAPKGG